MEFVVRKKNKTLEAKEVNMQSLVGLRQTHSLESDLHTKTANLTLT